MAIKFGKVDGMKCPECGAEDVYISPTVSTAVDEDTNEVLGRVETATCTCHNCGMPIPNKKVFRYNEKLHGELMRQIVNGLPLKTIRGLPIRYGISRKDFKIVMGIPDEREKCGMWIEYHIFDGDMPSEKEEERLKAIDKDPKVWIELLKISKDKISEEAYEKSMAKALEMVK